MAPFTFTLYAPYNKAAALKVKNTNVRMFGADIMMEKDESDGYFRATVDLADGIYHYQFKIVTKSWFEAEPEPALPDYENDEQYNEMTSAEKLEKTEEHSKLLAEIRERNRQREEEATFTEIWYTFVDPYATDVDERGTDDAHKAVGILTIKNGKRIIDEYEWKYDDCMLPPDEELVIYELHVGYGGEKDTYTRGQFKHVIEKIEYLKKLGVNAIELMPIKEYPGNHSWGYNPRYYFAIETSYGTTADMKEMVDEFHKNGMRVICDGVYNHSDCSSPLTQIDHDYWYHHNPKDVSMSWGPEWNYNHFDQKYNVWPARKFIGDSIRYMVEEFHIDARQIQNFDFLHWVTKEAKKAAGSKPFYTVAEFLPDEPCITNIDGPMDGCWHDSFYWALRDCILQDNVDLERLKSVIDCRRQGFFGVSNVVNYIGNHDHDRLFVELGKERNIFGDEAFRRIRLGVVIQMTAIGIPMIWMGEEIGEYKEKSPGVSKIDWSLIDERPDNSNAQNKALVAFYCGLIHLRKGNKAFFSTNLEYIHEDGNTKVLAFQRWSDTGDRVVVIINFSANFLAGYKVPGLPCNGRWHEWTFNYDITNANNEVILDLAEHEAKILVWRGDDKPQEQPQQVEKPAPNLTQTQNEEKTPEQKEQQPPIQQQ
ncbi:unnamed protein product [Didymodactylos carnosus]|uniref:Glycosyl hydrolase family 13 catalytic domain-containing protein n=1 Tax=Didymodactylos carnosus TaxID=1234261 RepID=A0A8S2CRI9_9BILA|nr:unnamed protein product [Didymodactylos carnosus]CAF3540553.1 unnamed protein product [Didymodactylos carnosus]